MVLAGLEAMITMALVMEASIVTGRVVLNIHVAKAAVVAAEVFEKQPNAENENDNKA